METFPDMNGKRVKGQSCARTCSIITIKCNVGELSERPQGIPMDTRSPNVHKESPDYPPHFSVRLQCRPSIPHLSDVFEGPSEGTRTHAQEQRLWYVLEDLLKSICRGMSRAKRLLIWCVRVGGGEGDGGTWGANGPHDCPTEPQRCKTIATPQQKSPYNFSPCTEIAI